LAKKSSDEKQDGESDYTFVIPEFDEAAYREKDILSTRITFAVVAFGVVVGIIAWVLTILPGIDWRLGWLPLFAGTAALKPALQRFKFPEDSLNFRALWGSYFLLFFTALAIWVLLFNVYS